MTAGRTLRAPSADVPGPDRHVPGETGVWVLIFGDMLLFGVFFTTYSIYRGRAVELFTEAQGLLDVDLAVLNTLLLLTSSLLVVTGVRALRRGAGKPGAQLFAGAWLCGLGFGVVKYFEYGDKLAAGITPMTNDFFMFYYVLTGLHLFHVLLGLVALTYMFVQSLKPRITVSRLRNVESGGCFWHLVDLLWIVLFPLLYLVRV